MPRGQGAVQIKFVTRSGTNTFTRQRLRVLPQRQAEREHLVQQPQRRRQAEAEAEPVRLPRRRPDRDPRAFDGHNKAFFFVNYEEFRQPSDTTRNRTVLTPAAQAGNFSYDGGTCVNVLALAAANGQLVDARSDDRASCSATSAPRRASTGSHRRRRIRNLQQLHLQRAGRSRCAAIRPARVDYNLTNKHRSQRRVQLPEVHRLARHAQQPRRRVPGLPDQASQTSSAWRSATALRSTLTRNMVNEARWPTAATPVQFFPELNAGMFTGDGRQSATASRSNFPTRRLGADQRRAPNAGAAVAQRHDARLIENTVTWLKGSHSDHDGRLWSRSITLWLKNSTLVPRAIIDRAVPNGSGERAVHDRELSRRVGGATCRPRRSTSTRCSPAASPDQRRRAPRRADRQVRLRGHRHSSAAACSEYGGYAAGSVARSSRT